MINEFLDWAQQQPNGLFFFCNPQEPKLTVNETEMHSMDSLQRPAPRLGAPPRSHLATFIPEFPEMLDAKHPSWDQDLQWYPEYGTGSVAGVPVPRLPVSYMRKR
jgi:hypothetical protein